MKMDEILNSYLPAAEKMQLYNKSLGDIQIILTKNSGETKSC